MKKKTKTETKAETEKKGGETEKYKIKLREKQICTYIIHLTQKIGRDGKYNLLFLFLILLLLPFILFFFHFFVSLSALRHGFGVSESWVCFAVPQRRRFAPDCHSAFGECSI